MPFERDAGLADILDELTVAYITDPISAASLSGSFARGDANTFSDIDFRLYTELPLEDMEGERLEYRQGRLVSISYHTFRGERRQFADPPSAVFAVSPIQALIPLHDRAGLLAWLQEEARAFRWENFASKADAYAARVVYQQAEVVHKLLGSLAGIRPLRAVLSTMELIQELTLAMAVAKRVLVISDRTYFSQVHQAVGEDSRWAAAHRRALGVTGEPDARDTYQIRAVAALRMYCETTEIMSALFTGQQRAVISEVNAIMAKSGLVGPSLP